MSEHIDRPKFKEFRPDDKIPDEYDIVQLKMDGIWGRMVIRDGTMEVYSRTGKLKDEGLIDNPNIDCVLLGEYMKGSHWGHKMDVDGYFYAFDCIEIHGQDLTSYPLADRISIASKEVSQLPWWVVMLETFDVSEYKSLWKKYVEDLAYEGLVFKNSSSAYADKNAWSRMKGVVEMEYICHGFRDADKGTKYEGQVGAVIGTLADKEVYVTCGGLTEEQRKLYTMHQNEFIGKVFTAKGNAWYPSGSIRHPKFKQWRPDKLIQECTYDQIPEAIQ